MNKPFRLEVDASGTAIGHILSQFDDQSHPNVIAYGGRSLRQNEVKWDVTDREGLGLVEAIKLYHTYLAHVHFEFFTDHIALKWLQILKLGIGPQVRWSLLLQQYDFTINHKAGAKNQNADAFSMRAYPATPDVQSDDEIDFSEIVATISSKDQTISQNPPPTPSHSISVNFEYPSQPSISHIATDDQNTAAELFRPATTPQIAKKHLTISI